MAPLRERAYWWAAERGYHNNPLDCTGTDDGSVLHAYDAAGMNELYNSYNPSVRYADAGVAVPTVFQSRVYVGTSGQVHGPPFLYAANTPAIGVDSSTGTHAGDLYVVMYNWTGTFMQVVVVHSTDSGITWSKPVPVAPGITHDQFLPWLSVSPDGLVGVMWLDRRNDPTNVSFQAFAAISADGGLSFQPNVQLTQEFSNPNVGGMGNASYNGAAWDGPNYFLVAWMDTSNGVNTQDFVGGIRLK